MSTVRPTGQYDGDNSSVEILSSQLCLGLCRVDRKTNSKAQKAFPHLTPETRVNSQAPPQPQCLAHSSFTIGLQQTGLPSSLLPRLWCLYLISICEQTCEHVCACGGPKLKTGIFLIHFLPSFFSELGSVNRADTPDRLAGW